MNGKEFRHLISAVVILFAVSAFEYSLSSNWVKFAQIFFFSILIVFLTVSAKKIVAYSLDTDVEHELWSLGRYGFSQDSKFKKPLSAGIILPLSISLISWGKTKVLPILTFEARALKHRAAKRFGYYSYAEITDWHNALIGSAGIIAALLIAVITYFLPYNLEFLAKLAAFYAFWNVIPVSNLDGTQIFFGSKVLWSILAAITLIITMYALII